MVIFHCYAGSPEGMHFYHPQIGLLLLWGVDIIPNSWALMGPQGQGPIPAPWGFGWMFGRWESPLEQWAG